MPFFFGPHCSSKIQSVRRKEESRRQTSCGGGTFSDVYRDIMLSSEAVLLISLFPLKHMVCSHAVLSPPATFPKPKETPFFQASFPPNAMFSHRDQYHGSIFLQNVFLTV